MLLNRQGIRKTINRSTNVHNALTEQKMKQLCPILVAYQLYSHVLTGFCCSWMGTVATGTVFMSNGASAGSFRYAAKARSRPTTDTLRAKNDSQGISYEN